MTLNITIASPEVIYQSADFRLIDMVSRRKKDFISQKGWLIQRQGWHATVCFAGIGHTGTLDVGQWLGATLAALPGDSRFSALITALGSADKWLMQIPSAQRLHTFTVGGFIETRPIVALVSNFQTITDAPFRWRRILRPTHVYPQRASVWLSGGGKSRVVEEDQHKLVDLVEKKAEHSVVMAALAQLNERVAEVPNSSVSPACFTTYVNITGGGGGAPHRISEELNPHEDYTPEFTGLGHIAQTLRRAVDEQGRPQPIRMAQFAMQRSQATERFHQQQIESNPTSPDAYNNYGVYLLDVAKSPERARQYYNKALALDSNHANANGNLANLLWKDGALAEAEQHYQHAVDADSKNSLHWENFARFIETARHDSLAAESLYRAGLDANPDAPRLIFNLGHSYFRRREWHRAIEAYEHYRRISPQDTEGTVCLAVAMWMGRQDVDECIRLYEEVLAIEPAHPVVLLNLTQLKYLSGSSADAEQLLLRCEQLDLERGQRLELLFYKFLHADGNPVLPEITALLREGVRIPQWEFGPSVDKAVQNGKVEADLAMLLAGVITDRDALDVLESRIARSNS